MFCLGCGAETPVRAAKCPICGRSLSRSTDAPEAARDTYADSPAPPSRPLAALASSPIRSDLHSPPAASLIPAASATGLPGDTAGRVLLLAVLALAADLLAPWSIVYGQQKTMATNSATALALLAIFALAALPLLRPNYRPRPLFAVAPLVVGAFCLGAGIFYWALLARENAALQPIADPSSSTIVVVGSRPATWQPTIVPGFGLYLFLLGGVVLAVVGYQLFLQAALASARATVGATAQPASTHSATAPASASMPLVTPISPVTAVAAPAAASLPFAAVSASDSRPVSSASSSPARSATPVRSIALPGTAAWNEAPNLPAHVRPSRLGGGGRSRQAGVHR